MSWEAGVTGRGRYGEGAASSDYTLYMDESGSGSEAGYLAVAGILVRRGRADGIWDRCHTIAKRHSKGEVDELKFSDMINDKGNFPGADGCRKGPAGGILDIIRGEKEVLFAMIVSKGKFPREPSDYEDEDHYATERVIIAALDYAATRRSSIDVVRDENSKKRDIKIKEALNHKRSDGAYRDGAGTVISNIEWYDRGGHGYRSGNSKKCKGLQLADSCVGAIARVMNREESDCYPRIRPLLGTPLNNGAIPMFYPEDGPSSPRKVFLERTGV